MDSNAKHLAEVRKALESGNETHRKELEVAHGEAESAKKALADKQAILNDVNEEVGGGGSC